MNINIYDVLQQPINAADVAANVATWPFTSREPVVCAHWQIWRVRGAWPPNVRRFLFWKKTDYRTNWLTRSIVQMQNAFSFTGPLAPDPCTRGSALDPSGGLPTVPPCRLALRAYHVAPKIHGRRSAEKSRGGPPLPPFPPHPLEVGPLNPARESGEHCKLPQKGLGLSPSRNWIYAF